MNTIFISCWHNSARNWIKTENWKWCLWTYKDIGAIDPKNKENSEYRWVRKVANQIFKLWFWTTKDHVIQIVPEWLNLDDRIKFINKRCIDGDICIELHMNAGGWTWTEVFAHGSSSYALNKASIMSSTLAKTMELTNRGAKPDTQTRFWRLWFIRDTKPLAFLIELWFIDNDKDRDAVWVNGAKAVISAINII